MEYDPKGIDNQNKVIKYTWESLHFVLRRCLVFKIQNMRNAVLTFGLQLWLTTAIIV